MKTRNLLNLAVLTLSIASCSSKNQVDSTLPKLQQDINNLNSTVAGLEKQLKDAENNKVANLEKKLQEAENKRKELEKSLQQAEKKKDELQKGLDEKETKQTELNEQIKTLRDQITSLQEKGEKVDDLQKQLKKKEEEKAELNSKIKKLQEDVEFWDLRLKKMTVLEQDLKKAEDKNKEDLEKIKRLEEDLESKNTELNNKTNELNDAKTKEADLNTKIEKNKQEIKKLNEQIAALAASGTDAEKITNLQSKVSQLESDLAEKENARKLLADTVTALSGTINTLINEKDEKQRTIDSLNNQIATLQASGIASQEQINTLTSKVAKLETDIEKAEEKKTELTNKVGELNEKITNLTAEKNQKQEKIDELTSKIEALKTSGTASQQQIAQLQDQVSQLQTDIQKAEEKKTELTNKVDELNGKVDELTAEKNAKQTKIETLTSQIATLTSNNATSQAKITELTDKVSQLENDIKEKEKAKKKAEDKVAELNDKVDELAAEKNAKQTEIETLTSQIATLTATSQTKITELQSRVSQLENDVAAKEMARQQLADQLSELQTQIETLKREKNEKDEEIKNLKEQLKSQGGAAELRAELALKEKEIRILKAIYDKNDPRYKSLDFIVFDKIKVGNSGERKDVVKVERKNKRYVYTGLTEVEKEFKFTDDDFELGVNGNETASKTENLNYTEKLCIGGGKGEPCDESKIPELKAILAKYETTTNSSDLNNLTDTEKEYICSMQGGACQHSNGHKVLKKAYAELSADNKKEIGWVKTILNEGKRQLNVTYDLSVKGTMEKGGSAVKLSYADFGMFEGKIDINSVNSNIIDPVVKAEVDEVFKQQNQGYTRTSYFIQGIDELKASVHTGSNDMTFKGKTFATLEKRHCNGNCSESLNGDVKLSVTGATAMGKLELDFGSSLNLQATNLDLTKNTFNDWEFYNNFTATGSKIDGYTKHDPNGTKLNLNMYGPEADKPTEAVGIYKFGFQRNCHGGPECEELRLKGAFGAKKE